MPRLSKIGAAALAAFGWTTGGASVAATYLQVAGGGAGGGLYWGGGGGAGGLLTGSVSLNPATTYTIVVGAGGANSSGTGVGFSGSNSTITGTGISITASVGGGGGAYAAAGANGGSGGGGGSSPAQSGGSGTSGQGNAGGTGSAGAAQGYSCGGGGGAGAVGSNASSAQGGAGGIGSTSSISGTSTYYAGGGGGGVRTGTGGTGGSGGGGNGGAGDGGSNNGFPGTANTGGGGGGGGGAGAAEIGGAGGSGIVIISYVGVQKFSGGVVTSSGGNTIHTFTTSGTLGPITPLSANYLVVAGGGGAGTYGGGGAGGLQAGSALTIDPSSIYLVTVGAGGAGSTSDSVNGSNGATSSFFSVSSTGGGGGAFPSSAGSNGGSGGGGGGGTTPGNAGGTGTSGQGNNGGRGLTDSVTYTAGGGGGGAGAVGSNAASQAGGAGGAGTASSISGTSVTYAGGGGGRTNVGTSAAGGSGGGGQAYTSGTIGGSGTANTGGGGGGGSSAAGGGGAGGSGIVIISYAGSTQQMAGGTVTISGGNVIHTFTSSGYLTPIKYVSKSLRFRSSASAYLSRTNSSSPTLGTKQTISAWVKRGALGGAYSLLFAGYDGSSSNAFFLGFTSDNLQMQFGGASANNITTSAVYRDPAAWYHIVLAIDTAQATAANRVLLYVNGVQATAFSASNYPAQNATCQFGLANSNNKIGAVYTGTNYWFDGYMTEVNFIDGQALTPSSFGTFNAYGVWQPITYGGSYGTNGFYLPFTNTTSTTTLGYDFSPNGNNWTTNNISLTAGVTYDSMTDVPTLTSATAANYCVLNRLDADTSAVLTSITNGNLTASGTTYGATVYTCSMPIPQTGKWYWEFVYSTITTTVVPGVRSNSTGSTDIQYYSNGNKNVAGSVTAYGSSWTTGDLMACAVDRDAGTVTWYKNNVSQGAISIPNNAAVFDIAFNVLSPYGSTTFNANFGQRPFSYTPPSGHLALNTYNM